MPASGRWSFPLFPRTELDRQVLALCSPQATLPHDSDPEALLGRAAALDLFPLASHRLRSSSPALAAEWEERFRANAARNLYLHHEQSRLLAQLTAAGVCAAPLKGTALAELAHGDIALRAQVDVDFYVSPRDLRTALEVVTSAGYRQATPAGVPAERLARTGDDFTSECSLVSTGDTVPVLLELHWRLLPLPEEELRAALQPSSSLPPDLNLLYLCLNAAKNRWSSLKLLADLAHWLEHQAPDWEKVLAQARRLGLRRILGITLDAVEAYFGTTAPATVRAALTSARPRTLPAAGVANPFAPYETVPPAVCHRIRLSLFERGRDRLRYAARLLRPTASDVASVRLPRRVGFLYWGVRWLRLGGLLKNDGKPEPRRPAEVHP